MDSNTSETVGYVQVVDNIAASNSDTDDAFKEALRKLQEEYDKVKAKPSCGWGCGCCNCPCRRYNYPYNPYPYYPAYPTYTQWTYSAPNSGQTTSGY